MTTAHHGRFPKTIQLGLTMAIASAGLIYLGPKLMTPSGYDFRVIWLAGRLWAAGENPYGDAQAAAYAGIFGPEPSALVYPPYWFPIAVPFGFLPFETAAVAWQVLSFALVAAALALTSLIAVGKDPVRFWTIFLLGLGYVSLMQATALGTSYGQTSLLLCFALAAIFYGLSRKNAWVLALGLIAVAMKPNIGAVFYVAVATMPEWRRTLAVIIVLLLVAAAPALIHAPLEAISGLLTNLGRYTSLPPNIPGNMVGLYHFTAGLPSKPIANMLVVSAMIVVSAVFRLRIGEALKFAGVTMAILMLVPLHSYDMTVLAIPAIFLWSRATIDPRSWLDPRTLLASAGFLICLRPHNLADVLGIAQDYMFPECGPLTLGLLLIVLSLLIPGDGAHVRGKSVGEGDGSLLKSSIGT